MPLNANDYLPVQFGGNMGQSGPNQSNSGGGYGAQLGDINSLLQGIVQHGYYKTSPLTLQMLQNYLSGNQQRAAGQAGQFAGAYAASKGYSPYAYSQHAQGDVYNQYADKFAQLPGMAFQSQLGANQQNFGMMATLLGLRGSALGGQNQEEQSKFNFLRDVVPGALKLAGSAILGGL